MNKLSKYHKNYRFFKAFRHYFTVIHGNINRVYSYIRFGIAADISMDSHIINAKKHIKIGKNFYAGKYLWIEAVIEHHGEQFQPQILIGENVSFSNFNHIAATHYIKIGNNVLFGSKCYVTDHNHGIYSGNEGEQTNPEVPPTQRKLPSNKKVIIEDNVWIGDNVVVLPDVTIGKCSIIGSNAVVSKNIPSYSIAVGVPARVIKQWNTNQKQWISIKKTT